MRTGGRHRTAKPRGNVGRGGGARATDESERARGSPRGPDGARAKGGARQQRHGGHQTPGNMKS